MDTGGAFNDSSMGIVTLVFIDLVGPLDADFSGRLIICNHAMGFFYS